MLILTLHAIEATKQSIVFSPVCLCVCVFLCLSKNQKGTHVTWQEMGYIAS